MNILKWADWDIQEVTDTDEECWITAKCKIHPTVCEKCGSIDTLLKNGTKKQLFKDLPSFGKQVTIITARQKYSCTACGKWFVQPLAEIGHRGRMTKRLVEYVRQQALARPFLHIAEEVGIDEKTVRNILKEHSRHLVKHSPMPTPEWLGIDEVHVMRTYHCILTNLKDGSICDFLPSRRQVELVRYLSTLKDKETVKVVCIDMSTHFRDIVVATLPHVAIVVDRFHVVRLMTKAFDEVRKSVGHELRKSQRIDLKNERFLLLKRGEKLNKDAKLTVTRWLLLNERLMAAYKIKERFYAIWDADSKEEARRRYWAWSYSIPKELHKYFREVTRPMDTWLEEILNYFDYPITNGYTEGMNNFIKTVVRRGRGYGQEMLRAKLLYEKAGNPAAVRRSRMRREQWQRRYKKR